MSEYIFSGIDVSSWQEKFDWDKAKAAGVHTAYIRTTFNRMVDTQFKRNWQEAKRVGIARGAYGWVISDQNQVANADLFVDQFRNDPGELPPAADFEYCTYWTGGRKLVSQPGFAALQAFITRVEKFQKPLIYTSPGYWNGLANHKNQTWALDYDLWVANYTTREQPSLPSVWASSGKSWRFWQYTAAGDGHVYGTPRAGMGIDLNRFNGDVFNLLDYIGVTEEPQPAPAPGFVRVKVGWLFFRQRPELYQGAALAVGQGTLLELIEPEKIHTDIDYWHVRKDGFEGYVSAGSAYTERI